MESNLFMELSEEQQELITGANNAAIALLDASFFKTNTVAGRSATAAGPGGATAASSAAAQEIDSAALDITLAASGVPSIGYPDAYPGYLDD